MSCQQGPMRKDGQQVDLPTLEHIDKWEPIRLSSSIVALELINKWERIWLTSSILDLGWQVNLPDGKVLLAHIRTNILQIVY